MALRLLQFFQTSIESWMNLQTQYDVWLIKKTGKHIKVKPMDGAA
jgi:plasmid maintenance system antidote protein VapI